MKKSLGLILVMLVIVSTAFATKGDGKKTSYEIDTKESKVYWTGKKITGSSHNGHILIGAGTIDVDGQKVVGGALNIDLNSIVCLDLENEEYNKKLVDHLKGDDFFSVEKYPTAKFEITSVNKGAGSEYKVTGNLVMKGITKEIVFPAKISVSEGKVSAKGSASLDRTKWNIQYGSGSIFKELGDKAINDEMEITFDLVANVHDVKLSEK